MIYDKDDIPLIVQKIIYHYGDMMITVYFFNGKSLTFPVENFCNIGLMQKRFTRHQEFEVENNITRFATKNWSDLFPNC